MELRKLAIPNIIHVYDLVNYACNLLQELQCLSVAVHPLNEISVHAPDVICVSKNLVLQHQHYAQHECKCREYCLQAIFDIPLSI